ncbi:MAG TPA: ABC transporter permease [Chloroflexota bacterium]|nr:ABC transporter permease [Chloroflexota bacterium]
MHGFLARRLIGLLITVFAVSFVAYVALTFAPGDAAEALIGENASQEQVEALRRQMKLDAPLLERYGDYMAGAVMRRDLGQSLSTGRGVADLLMERLPSTVSLALVSMALATVVGFGLGLAAALKPRSRLDMMAVGGAALGVALPPYWVALLLVMLFSLKLGWLPVFGSGTPAHMVLPAVTLAMPGAAVLARLVRSSVLDVKGADYVRTAVSKGLGPRQTMLRHVLPNSLMPALTILGLNLSHLLGGAFVVETIFAWPGLGRLMVQAIFDRDIPVVMGAVLVVVPMALLVTLVVDLLHSALDPRVRHHAI